MADVYLKEDGLLRDYRKLSQEYKNKTGKYIKNLLRIQRAETDVEKKISFIEDLPKDEPSEEIYCSFCKKPQYEVERLIVASYKNDMIYICNECIELCNEILDENSDLYKDL